MAGSGTLCRPSQRCGIPGWTCELRSTNKSEVLERRDFLRTKPNRGGPTIYGLRGRMCSPSLHYSDQKASEIICRAH
eukprot:scaffold613_cov325-Pavlova_lutheri.AAC.4